MEGNNKKASGDEVAQYVHELEAVDPWVGSRVGYYAVLKKAGRNKYYQQRYQVRCECCKQIFVRTRNKIKEAEGQDVCRHTKRTTKPAAAPHPCAFCGRMTTNLKYCSNTCKSIDVNIKTKTKPPKHCLLCGRPTPNRNSDLCSPECRRLYRLRKMYGFEADTLMNGGGACGG